VRTRGTQLSRTRLFRSPAWRAPPGGVWALRRGGAADDVAAGFFVELELEEAARLRLLEQLAERAETVGRFVEAGTAALQCLLHHRAPQLGGVATLGVQGLDRLQHEAD